jgi:hypothetical protein
MPSIESVADQLIAKDLPVIFLDTCVLLDVIRAIKRRTRDWVASARELREAVSGTPARCVSVVSHLVRHEWEDNQQSVSAEASKHLSELQEQSICFHDVCGVLGIVPEFSPADYPGLAVAEELRELSRSLLDSGLELDADVACEGRAVARVIDKIPPANKGQQVKDCIILEQYLAVCRQLQIVGFEKKRVFCTSNTNDYFKAGQLHPELAIDLDGVGLRFTTNLHWGFHDLTH